MKLKTLCWSVGLVFSAAGCANLGQPAGDQPLRIQPQLELGQMGPDALYTLGRYYQGRFEYDRALAAYRGALDRDPTFVDAHNGLATMYAVQGRYDDAVRELQAAIARAPVAAYLHNNLGYVYLLRGSNEEAVREFKEALRLQPEQQRALQNLKLAQSRLGTQTAAAATPKAVDAARSVPADAIAKPKKVIAPLKSAGVQRSGARVEPIGPNVFQLQIPSPPTVFQLPPVRPSPLEPARLSRPVPALKPVAWQETNLPLQRFRLEVSNGNAVNGLAKRVARHLNSEGLPAARLTNQRPFTQPDTQIQYRKGFAAEAAALRSKLQDGVITVETERLARYVDVRLVLGRDYRSETALLLPADTTVQVGMLAR